MLTSTSTNPPERCDEDLLQEASRWTALISKRAPTSRERDELTMWLDGDARRAAALELTMEAWDKAPDLLGYVRSREDRNFSLAGILRSAAPRRAAFAFAIGCFLLLAFLWTGRGGELQQYRADQTQQALVLADGSHVTIEPGGRIEVNFNETARSVRLLAGRAEFDVVTSTRPFVVDARGLQVEVLGTAFSIDVRAERTDVRLHRGKIALKRGSHRLAELHPGDQATFRPNSHRLELVRMDSSGQAVASGSAPDGTSLMAAAGTVTANGERLDRVAALLEHETGRRLRLANAQIGAIEFTGHIGLRNLEGDLQRAIRPYGLTLVEQPDGLLLKPQNPDAQH